MSNELQIVGYITRSRRFVLAELDPSPELIEGAIVLTDHTAAIAQIEALKAQLQQQALTRSVHEGEWIEKVSKMADEIAALKAQLEEARAKAALHAASHLAAERELEAAKDQIAELMERCEAAERDAALWQEWLPWVRKLRKKPFDLAMTISRLDAALTSQPQGGA